MKEIILIKNGELALKGLNRHVFEDRMIKTLKSVLYGLGPIEISRSQSTVMVEPTGEDYPMEKALRRVGKVFGIAAYCRAAVAPKNMEQILTLAPDYLKAQLQQVKTFKVEAKRSDKAFALTSPQISRELGAVLFVRSKGGLKLTPQGEIAVKYARRLKALDQKLHRELINVEKSITNLRIGITHTAESNLTTQVLAKCANQHSGLSITITTDTIKNLYEMLENYEIDLAIVEGSPTSSAFSSLMLDTDYLVCVMAVTHPLASHAMVTLSELKGEQMILRLPSSATRTLFESTLESINDSIENFNVTIEVDNIATIKDLVRKELGVSILPKSACMDELSKGKLAALPIENLSMVRETRIVYNRDFSHFDILQEITKTYQETAKAQR